MGTFISIPGGGNANVNIYGNGTVVAGNGNDTICITGNGAMTVGAGNDHLTLLGSGSITQNNTLTKQGHDTINLGHGNDTISEAGRATVYGSFGSATIEGGKFEFLRVRDTSLHGNQHDQGNQHHQHLMINEEVALSGSATLVGGDHCTQFVGGTGSVVMHGGRGDDTFVGGSGHATMTGGSGHNLFEFASHANGGMDVITNFVSGHDKLYLEGKTLSYLQSHGDISVSHGNTFISLDGGHTTVELKGFTHLTSPDLTTHKG
jgi:Ca2+-binding RTX toxin-like protein